MLASLQAHAARYKRHIVPLLSMRADFYFRVFVRVYTSPLMVKRAGWCAPCSREARSGLTVARSNVSYVYQCSGCEGFRWQPVMKVAGRPGAPHFVPSTSTVPCECPQCNRRYHVRLCAVSVGPPC
jgi:tRNA (guanine26-N2/guanine27-N2)-dimethyltransferase